MKHHGHRYRMARAEMFARLGHTCAICGHDDAYEADHIDPTDDSPIHWTMLQPAHGTSHPCRVCLRKCNQSKGNKPAYQLHVPALDW